MKDTNEIDIPDWVPSSVVQRIRVFESYVLTEEQRSMLLRLATHEKMRSVWSTLMSRKREDNRFFYYPAVVGGTGLLHEIAQSEAIGQLFMYCFSSIKDKRAATTMEDIERRRAELFNRVNMLRETAQEIRQANINGPVAVDAEVAALDRVAEWYEAETKHLRDEMDPLTVQRHRANPIVRGAKTDCENAFELLFGRRLPGLAADIVEVGTGLKVTRDTGVRVKSAKSRP